MIIFLHGWGGRASHWQANETFFKEKGYSTVALKMPGFDLAEPPCDWGVPEYAKYVHEQITTIKPTSKVVLIGHSFGGRVAVYLASKEPNLISGLVLSDAAGLNLDINPLKIVAKALSSLGKILDKIFPISSKIRKVLVNMVGSKNYKDASPTMREVMKKVVDLDLRNNLPNIKCPTLVIWGDQDRVTPLNMAKYFHNHIKGSQLYLIKGGDHWVNSKNPQEWNKVVEDFLKNLNF